MVKIKITRSDGTIIEAEGPAEEILKLNLIPFPYPPIQFFTPQIDCAGGAGTGWGTTFTIPAK